VLQVPVSVLGDTTAACDGRPVIVSPSDDEHCLLSPNQTVSSIPAAYSLRVLARSKDIYTQLNHRSIYPNVTTLRSGRCYHKSICRPSVVCSVFAPYSGS